MQKNKNLIFLIILITPVFVFAQSGTIADLPVVPLSVSEMDYQEKPVKKRTTYKKPKNQGTPQRTRTNKKQPMKRSVPDKSGKFKEQYPLDIISKSGVNEIIPISSGFTNRFITPFEHPVVVTSAGKDVLSHTVSGNIVYIGTNSLKPLGIYITDKDNNMNAISMTVIPKAIPPREIRLTLVGYTKPNKGTRKKAVKWEMARPYIQTVKSIMRDMAFNKIPPGYSLENFAGSMLCNQEGLNVTAKQKLAGGNMDILVFKATNISMAPFLINEPSCYHAGIIAISSWPYARLELQQSTELYVIVKKQDNASPHLIRPSVID